MQTVTSHCRHDQTEHDSKPSEHRGTKTGENRPVTTAAPAQRERYAARVRPDPTASSVTRPRKQDDRRHPRHHVCAPLAYAKKGRPFFCVNTKFALIKTLFRI